MVIAILIGLGLCLGSFINALVWRVHQWSKSEKNRKNPMLSMTHGRSMCPHCRHQLAAADLIPLLSWLSLRGKCRYCGKKIEDSPVVEVATAMLFVLSYVAWPQGWSVLSMLQFGVWLATVVLLVALVVYDLRYMLLPNNLVAAATALAFLQLIIQFAQSHELGVLMSGFWGVVCIAGFFYVLFTISKEKWIGGGDVKLGVALGLLVGGPLASMLVIFIASTLGSLVSVPVIIMQKKNLKMRIPFGPFLVAATMLMYLYGPSIINWYSRLFLPS